MTKVMGVVNVTPDSFSDGGQFLDHQAALSHAKKLVAEGADVIDVGGESTRPGANPVGADEEIKRVLPVIAGLVGQVKGSVDTRHSEVARAAVDAGATLINDVSASLGELAGQLKVGWVAMHMQGDPHTMQKEPQYDDVVQEVRDYLVQRKRPEPPKFGSTPVWVSAKQPPTT